MRKLAIAIAATTALVGGIIISEVATAAPGPSQGIRQAAEDLSMLENVQYRYRRGGYYGGYRGGYGYRSYGYYPYYYTGAYASCWRVQYTQWGPRRVWVCGGAYPYY
jgi:hypothetical protein